MSLEFKPGSVVDPKRAVRFGAWRVAEYRFYAMSKWITSVIVFGLGNPILYLLSVGLGIGARGLKGMGIPSLHQRPSG